MCQIIIGNGIIYIAFILSRKEHNRGYYYCGRDNDVADNTMCKYSK